MERLPPVDVKFRIIMAPAAKNFSQTCNRHHVVVGNSNMFQLSPGISLQLAEMEDPPSTTLRVAMDFHRFSSSFQEAFHHLMFAASKKVRTSLSKSLSMLNDSSKSLLLTPPCPAFCMFQYSEQNTQTMQRILWHGKHDQSYRSLKTRYTWKSNLRFKKPKQ